MGVEHLNLTPDRGGYRGRRNTMKAGVKRFNQQSNIGKAKYVVNYHDGISHHKDGSDFFGIAIFKNKKKLADFLLGLWRAGYIET